MKKLSLATIAAVGLLAAGSASAADLATRPPYKAPPPMVAPVPVFTWSGCYIGANVGGGWTHKEFDFDGFPEGSHTASGVVGGGQVGCDYQFTPNWLIGIQTMWDGASLTGDNIVPDDPDDVFHTKIRWFGTLTGRLGFLVTPSFLIYGKGGVAWVGDSHSFTSTDGSGDGSTGNFTRTGWDAGGGFEWMFAPSWSVWVEYDHMGFGTKSESFLFTDGTFGFNENIKQSVDKVLVGINYRFGFGKGAPVVARY